MAEKTKQKQQRGLALRTDRPRLAGRLAERAARREELWTELDRRFDDMRRDLQSTFWGSPLALAPWMPSTAHLFPELRVPEAMETLAPRVDIRDNGGALVITADMPGIPRENIDISVDRNMVEISGEAEHSEAEKKEGYMRQERSYQRFYRALPLPDEVVADKAEACVKDGVLEITLPKKTPTPEGGKKRVNVK